MNKQTFLKHITDNFLDSSLVSINEGEINKLEIDSDTAPENANCHSCLYLKTELDVVHFYLVMNSINHQFWNHDESGNLLRYSHNNNVGALALSAGILGLADKHGGFNNLHAITETEFSTFFGDMPNASDRLKMLNQALGENGRTCAQKLIATKDSWTVMDAMTIAEDLPLGYRDEALKKAQLALYMAACGLRSKGFSANTSLTCFADYQVPRVLRHLGVLKYESPVASLVDNKLLIEKDSKIEKAIRGATILACEKISEKFNVSAEALDFWLWSRRNEAEKPFHLTVTNAY